MYLSAPAEHFQHCNCRYGSMPQSYITELKDAKWYIYIYIYVYVHDIHNIPWNKRRSHRSPILTIVLFYLLNVEFAAPRHPQNVDSTRWVLRFWKVLSKPDEISMVSWPGASRRMVPRNTRKFLACSHIRMEEIQSYMMFNNHVIKKIKNKGDVCNEHIERNICCNINYAYTQVAQYCIPK